MVFRNFERSSAPSAVLDGYVRGVAADYGESIQDEARIQAQVLERMFDDPNLVGLRSRHPRHPAVDRFDLLTDLVSSTGGFPWENGSQMAGAIATMLIDRSTWASNTDSTDYWSFITDESVRNQIRRRIWNPQQFGDVLAELFCFGWLMTEGFSTLLVGKEGLPDLMLQLNTGDLWAEVKRIRLGTQPTRVRKIIAKANRQIKRADPLGVGVAFISLARPVKHTGSDDRPPPDVQPYIDQVERQFASGHTKSVARAIVTWDDWIEHVNPLGVAVYTIRRRSVVLNHQTPRHELTLPDADMTIGMTAMVATGRRP